MKDFFDKEVQVGDEVVIIEPHYHNLVRGSIVKFTPKGAKVKYYAFCRGYERESFVGREFIKVEDTND